MKTAEQWNEELQTTLNHWIFVDVQSSEQNVDTITNLLKQIQLDAFKAGMIHAGQCCNDIDSTGILEITEHIDECADCITLETLHEYYDKPSQP